MNDRRLSNQIQDPAYSLSYIKNAAHFYFGLCCCAPSELAHPQQIFIF